MPTNTELLALADTTKVTCEYITQNSINGRKFTDKINKNTLFLPAAGYRAYDNGSLNNVGSSGYYWSSSVNGAGAYYLYFYSSTVSPGRNGSRGGGVSVRCVAE